MCTVCVQFLTEALLAAHALVTLRAARLPLALACVRLLPLLHVLVWGTALDALYRLALLTYLVELELLAREEAAGTRCLTLLLTLVALVAPRAA